MTFRMLCGLLLFSTCAVQAQHTRNMSQDLDDVTVRARKLKLENLLDSVIKYAPKNYIEPAIYAVRSITRLYRPEIDTPFRADIPAYLVKQEDYKYWMLRDTTEKVTVKDQLLEGQHQRIVSFRGYPEAANLLTFLERCAENSVTEKGFYAISGSDDELRYHVIVPYKFRRNLIARMFTTRMDEDTILSYSQYTIRRKGWVLEENTWKNTTASRELVRQFRKSKSYGEVDSLMEAARVREQARYCTGTKKWSEGDDGRYLFTDYTLQDNLLFFQDNLFQKKEEMRDYIYSYETHIDTTRQRTNPEGLRPFMILQFFRKGVKANPVTVTDND